MTKKTDSFEEALEANKPNNIYVKLLRVKSEIGTLTKKADNPFFKSKYLDLSDLLTAVEPVLEKHGLLLLQPITDGFVRTVIIDTESNGYSTRSEIALPTITDPQKLGSAITYFRRYTLQSLLSLQAIDDDGNHASKPEPKRLDADRFDSALVAIEGGKYTVEQLRNEWDLTPNQQATLQDFLTSK